MTIAVYNPSVFDREYTEIKFAHSHLKVEKWSAKDKEFKPASAEAFCVFNSDKKNECNLMIFEAVGFMETKIFRVTYDR